MFADWTQNKRCSRYDMTLELDQMRVAKTALETRCAVLEGQCEGIRAESLSHVLLCMKSNRITKLIQRETTRVSLAFVHITFLDNAPQKTRGEYNLSLSSLVDNHLLYAESVVGIPVGIPSNGIIDFWLHVFNSWKTNTIRRSHLDMKGLSNVMLVLFSPLFRIWLSLSLSLEE